MKKIVAIVGSNHKDSITEKYVKLWLKSMSQMDPEIHYEVCCLRDCKIDMCTGCTFCFHKGYCVLDEKDNMRILKEKLQNCDIVIFASPVYVLNLTGIMKNWIDRLASYCHTLYSVYTS